MKFEEWILSHEGTSNEILFNPRSCLMYSRKEAPEKEGEIEWELANVRDCAWLDEFDDETYQKIKGSLLRGGNKEEKKTLRDEFAMAALQGLLAEGEGIQIKYEDLAEWAYETADAMMNEREKKEGSSPPEVKT